MIYHYTTNGAQVLKSGVLKAQPMLIYRDLLAREQLLLEPVVWFTTSESVDLTVLIKAKCEHLKSVYRITVADETAPLDLIEWAYNHHHSSGLFKWMLLTGKLAGSDYRQWRLCEQDVDKSKWLEVVEINLHS